MTSERVGKRVIVRGEVQGVFFRDSTREQARRHGVAGWARNRGDGSVEVWLEGESAAVQAVVDFCREGPGRASVSEVSVSDGGSPEGLSGFEIR